MKKDDEDVFLIIRASTASTSTASEDEDSEESANS